MIRICWSRIRDSMQSIAHTRSGSRAVVIALAVVVFHVLALWALQSGLLHRIVDVVVPVQLLSEVIEPPRPVPPPPPPVVRPPPPQKVARTITPPAPPVPLPPPPLVVPVNPDPAPNAPTAVAAPPAPLPPMQAPVAPAPAAAVAPTPAPVAQRAPSPPRVELPSSDAAYLQNPRPVYPPMSKRLNEQGTVLVHVLIGADGTAQQAEILQSSTFDRLDQAALATVLKWRYVPGKRGGKPEPMWFTVPVTWELK